MRKVGVECFTVAVSTNSPDSWTPSTEAGEKFLQTVPDIEQQFFAYCVGKFRTKFLARFQVLRF